MADTKTFSQGKFPDEELDYLVDWTPALDGAETVSSVAVVKSDNSVDVDSPIVTTANQSRIWVRQGGREGFNLVLELLATTSAGRKIGLNAVIPIKAR